MSEIFPESPLTSLPAAVAFMGALPMPVGPRVLPLSAARLAEAEERGAHLYEFGGDATADEWNRLAGDDVPVLVKEIRRQAAEIAELNESVSTASEELRARQSCPCPPADRPGPHQVGCFFDGVPVSPPSERPVDGLTATFMPVASLRELSSREEPHDSPLHRPYTTPHDLDMP